MDADRDGDGEDLPGIAGRVISRQYSVVSHQHRSCIGGDWRLGLTTRIDD